MKVAWIATPASESEHDLALVPGVHLYSSHATTVPIFERAPSANTFEARLELLEWLAAESFDLYIFRYPYFLDEHPGLREHFFKLFRGMPVLAWGSEHGPTRVASVIYCRDFEHVAVTARCEQDLYRNRFVHYLPYGCVERAGVAEDRYRSDLVADGMAHYSCNWDNCWRFTHGGWKHESVDVMVRPVLDLDIGLWGRSRPLGHGEILEHGNPPEGIDVHSWAAFAPEKYRGVYPPSAVANVYASCKIYLGITWNWKHGSYGAKLARALASGITVLWHRTHRMQEDGLLDGVHLFAPSRPEETRALVLHLLQHPEEAVRVGQQGRRFALSEWGWEQGLRRLIDEVTRER